jgi:hypothetical protein
VIRNVDDPADLLAHLQAEHWPVYDHLPPEVFTKDLAELPEGLLDAIRARHEAEQPHGHDHGLGRYRIAEATLTIDQTLVMEEYQRLLELIGEPTPQRFKQWAGEFHFGLQIPASGDPLDHPAVAYAREQDLAHTVETDAVFDQGAADEG